MSHLATLLLSLIGSSLCLPSPPNHDPLSMGDEEWLSLHRARRVTYPQGFQFMYVGSDGRIVEAHKPSTGLWIEVVGSPQASHQALYEAAQVVRKMLLHSPTHVFANIANRAGAGVGIYSRQEKLTVFPENYRYADTPACHGRCDGSCSHTCTFDGRKYDTLGGLTTTRSMILEDNLMCSSHDPHHHRNNILVHEFAHSIMRYGMTTAERAQVDSAYAYAKQHHSWVDGSYAMANSREYFAEGTGAFFDVNFERTTIGGMIDCPGHTCRSEPEARENLRTHDVNLYNILSHIFTNGHPSTPSGLSVCPA